ncbi:MAG: PilN domain-containing protein [Proteobacteria bacterium]|nr:PilN domain-containing protein [Pseudomonadota bacterium]
MIRINLVPQKRKGPAERGQKSLLLGVILLLAAGTLAYLFVHKPLAEEIETLHSATARLDQDNRDKRNQLKGYKELKEAVKAAEERKKVIARLDNARATPAHMLYELSSILTPRRTPTMTRAMSNEVKENPNRELSPDWDPKHVWITKFSEKNGQFRLDGGSQSDSDMTQLALRLQASVYFHNVVPEGGQESVDKESGITFYKFTIVGKVAY